MRFDKCRAEELDSKPSIVLAFLAAASHCRLTYSLWAAKSTILSVATHCVQ